MSRILIISGHPDLSASVANAAILAHVARELPEAEIRRLDALYPDYQFDIEAEQSALLAATSSCSNFRFHGMPCPG